MKPVALVLLLVTAACHPPAAQTTIAVAPEPATTSLIGEGRLPAKPEYIELTVHIHSQCYDTPASASAANDRATAEVIKLLNTAADRDRQGDGVVSHGGLTQPFSRHIGGGRVACLGTFEKSGVAVLKTSRVAAFPGEFAEIQRRIYAGTLRKPAAPGNGPVTFATIDTPTPRLTHPTRERLERQALADALDNAREKLEAAAAIGCKGAKPKVVRFVERHPGDGRPIPYDRSTPASGAGAIEFDAIWINRLLEVHFALDCG